MTSGRREHVLKVLEIEKENLRNKIDETKALLDEYIKSTDEELEPDYQDYISIHEFINTPPPINTIWEFRIFRISISYAKYKSLIGQLEQL